MAAYVDVDAFVKKNQDQIVNLVNITLNKAGEAVKQRVEAGEVGPSLQEVLPLMLYEILVTHTVSTLRLAADMINESETQTRA